MNADFTMSALFVTMYNQKHLDFVISSGAPVSVMKKVYEILLHDKLIIPIEDLPEEKKKELVSECRATGLSFTNQTLTDAAKILHVIKFINQPKK